jgi:hypothetical protein
MSSFLLTSLIASILLTLAINILPAFFPKAAAKAEDKIIEKMREVQSERQNPKTPKVHVFFPWKAMIAASLLLTVLVNITVYLAR